MHDARNNLHLPARAENSDDAAAEGTNHQAVAPVEGWDELTLAARSARRPGMSFERPSASRIRIGPFRFPSGPAAILVSILFHVGLVAGAWALIRVIIADDDPLPPAAQPAMTDELEARSTNSLMVNRPAGLGSPALPRLEAEFPFSRDAVMPGDLPAMEQAVAEQPQRFERAAEAFWAATGRGDVRLGWSHPLLPLEIPLPGASHAARAPATRQP